MASQTFTTKLQAGRIALPSRVREQAGLSDGDRIRVTFVDKGVMIEARPARAKSSPTGIPSRAALERLTEQAPESFKRIWENAKRVGTSGMSMREIDTVVAEVRAEEAVKSKE